LKAQRIDFALPLLGIRVDANLKPVQGDPESRPFDHVP
jgi:hypothetical protein